MLTWWKLGRITRKQIVASVPWFIITAGAGWMAAWRERYGAGAHGKLYKFDTFQHLVIAGKDLWFYVEKLFWPHPILMVYPRWHVHGFTTVDILFPMAAAMVAVACFAAQKGCGRGLYQRALELNPCLARAHYFYGLDLLNHGHPRQAARQFRTVIALSPRHKSAYHLLAQALKAAGQQQSGGGR